MKIGVGGALVLAAATWIVARRRRARRLLSVPGLLFLALRIAVEAGDLWRERLLRRRLREAGLLADSSGSGA